MKPISILLAAHICLTASLNAQGSSCYETVMTAGKAKYAEGDYTSALKKFTAAQTCPDLPAKNDRQAWIDKCNNAMKPTKVTPPPPPKPSGPKDSDGDGLTDGIDRCPYEKGPVKLEGCPDADNDGIANAVDGCPYKSGPASNNGCPESYTTLYNLSDGSDTYNYTGYALDGKPEGSGKSTYTSGNVKSYEGNYKSGLRHKEGIMIWNNGDRYEGNWENGIRTGQGKYFWPSGTRYEGNWKNNNRSGYGIYYFSDGGRYEGNWENDKRTGQGKFFWLDGDRYEGSFENDLRHGYGIYYASSGTIKNCASCTRYEGYWKNHLKHGQGKCYDKNGKLLYSGNFADDKPTETYPNQ